MKNSTDACIAKAKLPKQQLFESLCWYSNVGAKGWNYISPVTFESPIGTGNVGMVFSDCLQYSAETAFLRNPVSVSWNYPQSSHDQ